MAALPLNPYPPATLWSDAFNKCLNLEPTAAPGMALTFLSLIHVHFFGYMILKASTDEGHTNYSSETCNCIDDEALFELAQIYESGFCVIFSVLAM
jgi:hypothetical protein